MNDDPQSVAPYRGPALVYGLWRDAYFVVLGAAWAAAAADEIDAILKAKTWAQAKVVSDAASHIGGPLRDDLAEYGLVPDELVVSDDIPGWVDGDWPPMVCIYTAKFLPVAWPIGESYSTTFSGDGVVIPTGDEQRLLGIARQSGAPLTRDDALIGRLDPQW